MKGVPMISITIPGVYTMKAKRSIVKVNAQAYKRAAKKQKTDMLNDLEKTLHCHRKYITTLLNRTGKFYYIPQGIKLVGDPNHHLSSPTRSKKEIHPRTPTLA